MKFWPILITVLICVSFQPSDAKNQTPNKTLSLIQKRGHLICGVSQSLPGFSFPEDDGQWSGLDVEVCQAVAAAVFGDVTKIKFIPLSAKERFTALQSGEVDILSRNTTWTFHRDVALGFNFTNITFYDGQGFMVPKSIGIASVKELSGATVCTNAGTTTELNVADYFRKHNMDYKIVTYEKADEVVAAYNAGRCDAYTTDRSGLAAQRIKLPTPDDHIILPETISKEPLGLVVRHFDDQWADIARWTFFGLLVAEENGITKDNIKEMLQSNNPEVRRLLGVEGQLGENLGLNNDFMVHVIASIGNYGEIFERNVGSQSQLKLERGLNQLWTAGGLMYAPPFR